MRYFPRPSWQACARVRSLRQHAFETPPAPSIFAMVSTRGISVACVSSPPTFRLSTAVLGFGPKCRIFRNTSQCLGMARLRYALGGSSSPRGGTIFVTRCRTTLLSFPTAGVGFYAFTMKRYFTSATATFNAAPHLMVTLHEILSDPSGNWSRRPPASEAAIRTLAAACDFALPQEYESFLRYSNGGEGPLCIEPWYFQLCSAEDVLSYNRDYKVGQFLPGFFAIGSSGGSEMLAIRKRDGSPCP